MKYIFLFVVFPLFACNQSSTINVDNVVIKDSAISTSKNIIDGIGKLKLGSSTKLLKEIGYDPETATSKFSFENISKLLPDSNNANTFPFSNHPLVKVFRIPKYEPVKGINCEYLILSYFNDSLYSIVIHNPNDLEEAFKLKYGEPEYFMEEREVDLNELSSNGVRIPTIDVIHMSPIKSSTYQKNDKLYRAVYNSGSEDVECYANKNIWVNEKVDGISLVAYYLIINNKKIKENVLLYDSEMNKIIKEEMDKKQLKKLDDL